MSEFQTKALATVAGLAVGVGGTAAGNVLHLDFASAQPAPQERVADVNPALPRFGGSLVFSEGQFAPKLEASDLTSTGDPVAKEAGSLDPPFYSARQCSDVTGTIQPYFFKAKYETGSKTNINFRIKMPNIYACKPNGTRLLKIYEEKELNGEFAKYSTSKNINAGVNPKDIKGSLKAPYNCDEQVTSIRATVELLWKAKKGKNNQRIFHYPVSKPNCK